jgi:hypothetical protein
VREDAFAQFIWNRYATYWLASIRTAESAISTKEIAGRVGLVAKEAGWIDKHRKNHHVHAAQAVGRPQSPRGLKPAADRAPPARTGAGGDRMSKRKKPEPMQVILVSYVPLLMGEAGRSDWDPKQVQEAMEEGPSGLADACVWLQDDEGRLGPCLLLPQADIIAEHLKLWAEGQPEEWFRLCAAEHGGLYGLGAHASARQGNRAVPHGLPAAARPASAQGHPRHGSVQAHALLVKPGHMFGQVKAHRATGCVLAVMGLGPGRSANPRGRTVGQGR